MGIKMGIKMKMGEVEKGFPPIFILILILILTK